MKYEVNETIFNQINENSAYLLGFIIADGHISKRGYLEISLAEEDKSHVQDLQNLFYKSILPVKIKINKPKIFNGKIHNTQNSCYFRVFRKKIVDDLDSLGISMNKSFTATIPKIDFGDNFNHFVRGLIDGDGCISYFQKAKSFCVHFIGSVSCCAELQRKLLNFGFSFKLKNETKYSKPMSTLWLFGNRKCLSFLNWLYRGSSLRLGRKYQKYLQCIDECKKRSTKPAKKGYCFNKIKNRFVVRITKNKRTIFNKSCETEAEASELSKRKREEFYNLGLI